MKFDLNADLGEGSGADEALLDIISSASIACGGHAGDEITMHVALRAAGRSARCSAPSQSRMRAMRSAANVRLVTFRILLGAVRSMGRGC